MYQVLDVLPGWMATYRHCTEPLGVGCVGAFAYNVEQDGNNEDGTSDDSNTIVENRCPVEARQDGGSSCDERLLETTLEESGIRDGNAWRDLCFACTRVGEVAGIHDENGASNGPSNSNDEHSLLVQTIKVRENDISAGSTPSQNSANRSGDNPRSDAIGDNSSDSSTTKNKKEKIKREIDSNDKEQTIVVETIKIRTADFLEDREPFSTTPDHGDAKNTTIHGKTGTKQNLWPIDPPGHVGDKKEKQNGFHKLLLFHHKLNINLQNHMRQHKERQRITRGRIRRKDKESWTRNERDQAEEQMLLLTPRARTEPSCRLSSNQTHPCRLESTAADVDLHMATEPPLKRSHSSPQPTLQRSFRGSKSHKLSPFRVARSLSFSVMTSPFGKSKSHKTGKTPRFEYLKDTE
ncbi:unnamed protein product [Pseudo-nitzschia multistriata]|uniref:Uncharacterized protein n=1 Tax=Pseudo-nitzschia multistriata TaxID=183589 RepID=A0A448Z4C7_9STRA|nr:unnamed protein product [Pseudo-nitzschia multistriata]